MKTYSTRAARSWIKVLALICATNALLFRGVDAACLDLVSPGDQGVGIAAFDDASCKDGGLGCFSSGACRYCKTKETSQAKHFMACPGAVQTPAPATAAPVPATAAPVTPAPVTPAPVTPAPAAIPTGSCASTVSPGDQGVGISAVADPTCKNGGLGCFPDGVCRYCKTKDTVQAGHFLACSSFAVAPPPTPAPSPSPTPAPTSSPPPTPAPTSSPPPTPAPTPEKPVGGTSSVVQCLEKASPGDLAVGVSVFTDATCSTSPGVGCFKDICRFCRTKETSASKNFVPCPETVVPAPSTAAPTTIAPATTAPATTAPATTAPATIPPATTAPPTSVAPVYTGKFCPTAVSVGDALVGINVITDPTCETNPSVGCFKDVCRFCKTRSTVQSQNFISCPANAIPAGPAATAVPSTAPPAVATTPPPPSTSTPAATTTTPVATAAAPAATPTLAPLSNQVVAQQCQRAVSSGDSLQGIAVVTDLTCGTAGGVGCVESCCRFCKTRDTPASQHFLPCANFAAVPVNTKTPASNICSSSIQAPQALGGVWTNVVCQEWYRGACLRYSCPLCKFADTKVSASLPVCVAPPSAPAIPAALPGAPDSNLCTEAILSEAQPSFGIWATWDDACTKSELDCVSKCRYCKYAETTQSSALKMCSSIKPLPPPPKYVPPAAGVTRPPPPVANECSKTLTTDEINTGIWRNAQCYATDAAGACVSVVCSPCSYFDTEASFKFPDCVNGIFPFWSTPSLALVRGMPMSETSALESDGPAAFGSLSPFEIVVAAAAAVGVAALFVAVMYSARQALQRSSSSASCTTPSNPSILSIVTSDESEAHRRPETPQRSMRPRKMRAPRTPVIA